MTGIFDMIGQELQLGDKIVYPGRHGSSTWMTISEIIEIKRKKNWQDKEQVYLITKMIKTNRYIWRERKIRNGCVSRLDRVLRVNGLPL